MRSRFDIEDLAQETYLRLLRTRDLGAVRYPQAYLFRVASTVIFEWQNARPRHQAFDEADETSFTSGGRMGLPLEVEESSRQLEQALETVSPATRAVVLLKYREGWQCKEIARNLQLTERQVRRRLTRAFERLRHALSE